MFSAQPRRKIKKEHAIVRLGNEAQLYDVTLSKEYEMQTNPLTSDEYEQMEQMLTSNLVHILFWKSTNREADILMIPPCLEVRRHHPPPPKRYDFYGSWRNMTLLTFGEFRKIRDCCVFRVNDLEVFL